MALMAVSLMGGWGRKGSVDLIDELTQTVNCTDVADTCGVADACNTVPPGPRIDSTVHN